ncbi:MAG: hypothetical protein JSS27_03500 [Planctomycetes bacterium]|nr:hypothetical protein [Planctomycetota bacterium]
MALRIVLLTMIVACAARTLCAQQTLEADGSDYERLVLPYTPASILAPQPSNPELPPAPSDVDRFQQLEARIQLLEDEAKQKAKADNSKPLVRTSLELQLDAYRVAQDATNLQQVGESPNGLAFRRARFAFMGDYSVASYRFEVDFAQPGRPSFLDMWAAINALPILGQVKAGNFFEPFGLERLTSNRYAPFMERNLPDQPFDPQRNPGIQAMNQWNGENGTWAIGVFRARSDNFADSTSFGGGPAVTGRLTWLPYYDEPSGGRYYTHVGTAFSYRSALNHSVVFEAQPEARLGAASPNIPFFLNTGPIAANAFSLHGFEFAASRGSLYVQGEATLIPVQTIGNGTAVFYGWYAQSGYFLTGEHRPYRREAATFDRVQPLTEFFRVRTRRGIGMGLGAVEIASRVSQLNLSDQGIAGGRMTDVTIGLNWYLNPYTRVTTNYIHPILYDLIGVGQADVFGSRIQFDY